MNSVVVDPACGTGNLLIPASARLRALCDEVGEAQVRGFDLHQVFVDAARFRVASEIGKLPGPDTFVAYDFLRHSKTVVDATHVVLNPPFIMIDKPPDANWANKRINAASLFVMQALEAMRVGSKLIALLPEVLRSGSTYSGWRREVEMRANHISVVPLGRFDALTNVDVFALYCDIALPHTPDESNLWRPATDAPHGTVGDHFDIRVGAVVPHRTPDGAARAPFLTANTAEPWTVVERVTVERAARARLDKGPFVAVRRTSSPKERERVRAVVVSDDRPIAVENHLIVLRPRSGRIEACLELMDALQDPRTSSFINDSIRCRHLTVGAIKSIPWWDEPGEAVIGDGPDSIRD
jgi:hypothetical protein